ncbi:hypothetical protein BJ508DRAFT_374523 [Ascobolus immersus RN42]|uniref:Uncharacterized protein n=1 Tax=Ascobolus immersus RN42 TaxID=1160509 RepID=A0A3N4IEP5_ASCIM|nr:hypothetical protein BJ508DRAFT_374523 [Ascobolus immersus RN42]
MPVARRMRITKLLHYGLFQIMNLNDDDGGEDEDLGDKDRTINFSRGKIQSLTDMAEKLAMNFRQFPCHLIRLRATLGITPHYFTLTAATVRLRQQSMSACYTLVWVTEGRGTDKNAGHWRRVPSDLGVSYTGNFAMTQANNLRQSATDPMSMRPKHETKQHRSSQVQQTSGEYTGNKGQLCRLSRCRKVLLHLGDFTLSALPSTFSAIP